MSIASSAIATAPISSVLKTGRVVASCVSEYGNAWVRCSSSQSYSIRLDAASVQEYGKPIVVAQIVQSYGPLMVSSINEHRWEPCVVVQSSLAERYADLLIQAQASFPYSNAPVQYQHEQPINFSVSASLESSWSILSSVQNQCEMPWAFLTPVAAQGVFRWDCLDRNPVVASLTQLWNLSSDRAIRIPDTAVRAFRSGEII